MRIDNICNNKYWNKSTKEFERCAELRYREDKICWRCEQRKEDSRIRRRYFPFKWNPSIVLDLHA